MHLIAHMRQSHARSTPRLVDRKVYLVESIHCAEVWSEFGRVAHLKGSQALRSHGLRPWRLEVLGSWEINSVKD